MELRLVLETTVLENKVVFGHHGTSIGALGEDEFVTKSESIETVLRKAWLGVMSQ